MTDISAATFTSLLSPEKLKPLVDIEAHSSVSNALHLMNQNHVTAIVVYGQKDHWIGAGGSQTIFKDANNIYIGIITILDMIVFLAKHNTNNSEGFKAFSEKTRVVNIIGQNRESQTLWIANPSLPLKLALEPLSKGVHRFLVPVSVPSTSVHPGYHMCSQSDIIANFAPFLNSNNINTKLAALARTPIAQLTASSIATLWTVEKTAPVVQVLTQLADQNLMAVPVIDAQTGILADTISVSDFRVLVVENRVTDDPTQRAGGDVQDMIQALLLSQEMTVGEFLEFVGKKNSRGGGSGHRRVLKGVVSGNVLFGDAVEKVVESKVHRLWIVDGFGVPTGVLSLGDMIRVIREVL